MKILFWSWVMCLATVAGLRADPVIRFDDLPSTQVAVPAGYHGLNWVNFMYLNAGAYGINPSGYEAGIVSSSNVIYGVGGGTAVISAGLFDFVSAYATAAWNDGLKMEAKGYIKGTLVYDQTNTLSATSPTLVSFNFYGVDEVDLTASGGTHHSGYIGSGTELVLDNVSVVTYVPYAPMLVTNGGFESGDFSGWSLFGSTNFTSVTASSAYTHSGSYGAQLGPLTNGYLLQELGPMVIGESYSVSFWLENSGAGSNIFTASLGLYPFFASANQAPLAWTNIQFNVLAARPSEALEFQYSNVPAFFGLDDISVTPALLISNGGFETGDFSGWSLSGNSSKAVSTAATARRAGSYGASFTASGSLGSISQNVTTYPGQPYLISLWLDSPDGQAPNRFQATWGGQTLLNQTGLGAFGWTNLHYTVINSSTQATLQFGLQDNNSALGLDEVTVAQVPILKNGGFEFGDFTGWTTSGNFTSCLVSTNQLYAGDGFYGGQFGPVSTLGYISQTFNTVPGQFYLIGFTLDNPAVMVNAEFNVTWNNTTLMDVTSLGLVGWLPYNFLVAATNTTSTLKFGFRDDPVGAYLGLDDVYVSPISTPVFQSIVRTNKLVNLTWSALPGYLYELQYSTNLTKTNWTTLGNLIFPFDFPMTATDTNPPDADRFYRVAMFPPPLIF